MSGTTWKLLRLCILFGGVLGSATHPSKPEFWQATIELWRGKTMYRHFANFHLALLHLGQNRGQHPHHQICLSSKIKGFCMQEANFWKEWTWLRYLHISHEAISAGNSPWVPTLWVGSESCVPGRRAILRGGLRRLFSTSFNCFK